MHYLNHEQIDVSLIYILIYFYYILENSLNLSQSSSKVKNFCITTRGMRLMQLLHGVLNSLDTSSFGELSIMEAFTRYWINKTIMGKWFELII